PVDRGRSRRSDSRKERPMYVTIMRTHRRSVALAALLGAAAVAGVSSSQGSHEAAVRSARTASRGGSFASRLLRFSPEAARIVAAARKSAPSRAGVAGVQLAGTPCGNTPGLLCSRIDVPLDRTGRVPGTISLAVQTLPPASGTP